MLQVKFLLKNIRPKYRRLLLLGFAISILTSMMQLIDPWLTSKLYDDVIVAKNPDPLLSILIAMLGVQLVRIALRYYMVLLFENASQDMLVRLRGSLFEKLQYQDMAFFDRIRTGDLMTRLQSDTDYCRHVVAWVGYQITDSVTLLCAALALFLYYSWKLTLLLLLVVPLILLATNLYHKRAHGKFRLFRERMADMNTAAQENIAGNRVVKAFVREDYERERFQEKNEAFRKVNLDINKTWLTVFPFMEGTAVLISAITVFVGGFFIMTGEITAGQLAMFTTLSFALTNPIRSIGPYMDDLQRCSSSITKIMEVYYAQPTVVDAPDAAAPETVRGEVAFHHVDFAFGEKAVLHDIDFSVPAGSTLAVMGPTGSGKTTLCSLISRLYDVTGGSITVDGCDVRKWKLSALRRAVGVATQEVFLFSDSIENNIAFSDLTMSEETAHDFARRAAVEEFAVKMPEGYETVVGERGVGLSGGQRQRIALARAMAARPAILILDDTTSALDMETEKYIQEQLKALPFSCTKIIIAQRISSVKDAECILVLQDGRIAERGTHKELLEKRGYYYETYALQNDLCDTTGGDRA